MLILFDCKMFKTYAPLRDESATPFAQAISHGIAGLSETDHWNVNASDGKSIKTHNLMHIITISNGGLLLYILNAKV